MSESRVGWQSTSKHGASQPLGVFATHTGTPEQIVMGPRFNAESKRRNKFEMVPRCGAESAELRAERPEQAHNTENNNPARALSRQTGGVCVCV